jgi:hypothetical protein
MTNVTNAASDPQKPANLAPASTPQQQTQGNPQTPGNAPTPADKPSEQQK